MPRRLTDKEIKDAVRQGYTARVKGGSCCGPTATPATGECGCGSPTALGYSNAELATLPQGAVANSFGCGNPAAFSDVKAGEVVLDIGSGAGIDCLIAARSVGAAGRVIGLDMTPAMIEKARGNARDAGVTNVEFRLGEAEAMPVADGSVDWVISNCVINLAPDKRAVFREVARVLKPGGRVAISDIVLADDVPELPTALKNDPELYVACVAGAIRESEYLAAMRDAGLVDVAVTARMTYGEDALGAFFQETLDRLEGGERMEGFLAELREAVVGRVWSARIIGRKPTGATRKPQPSPESVAVEDAGEGDASAIEGILVAVGLPGTDVREHIGHFLVARADGRIVGCAGLELYGQAALLRSLAVLPEQRGRGVGGRLAAAILAKARRLGAGEAVLLTTTVQGMAAGMGFQIVGRDLLPEAVRGSWEFKADCCGTATCMRLALAPEGALSAVTR
ncbi:MAG TPA: arsenite methyltransferase [Thermoanaerobaculaceae bacterium]|nr:arsenite methyltransferase [Thermoanaerobaculaceae bacterium]